MVVMVLVFLLGCQLEDLLLELVPGLLRPLQLGSCLLHALLQVMLDVNLGLEHLDLSLETFVLDGDSSHLRLPPLVCTTEPSN